MPFVVALVLSITVSFLGWAARTLTPGGAALASAIGTLVLWQTGWPGAAALGAFFVGSSLISRLAPDPGSLRGEAKGSRRDGWQVLANGGAALVGALIETVSPGTGIWLVAGSLAGAAADTWATAWGGWSRQTPRDVLSGVAVSPGTSGGVTLMGTAGSLAGAASVAAAAVAAGAPGPLGLAALAIGVATMGLDAVLGAGVQGRFHCDRCALPTERRVHRCGTPARHVRGWSWLSNDGVNALATTFGALAGWLAWRWWQP
jgi:uncharacterized protein (TIGR00297 family)